MYDFVDVDKWLYLQVNILRLCLQSPEAGAYRQVGNRGLLLDVPNLFQKLRLLVRIGSLSDTGEFRAFKDWPASLSAPFKVCCLPVSLLIGIAKLFLCSSMQRRPSSQHVHMLASHMHCFMEDSGSALHTLLGGFSKPLI